MRIIFPILAAAAITVALSHAPPAQAATSAANATAFCQSALPVFDTQIRKRPLAVSNEGTSGAFVSCSIPVGYNPGDITNGVVFMTNRGTKPVAVTCTLVDGVVPEAGIPDVPGYYPKTIELVPGVFTALLWDPADHGLDSFHVYQSYSCHLPPGVEINVVGHDYAEGA